MQARPDIGTVRRYRVGIAAATERATVEALRRAAYRGANEFDWNDEATLGWSAADDTGVVLAVWDAHGALLSTTRASVFTQLHEAEAHLEYSLAGIEVALPTLVLSRVATAPEAARHGLFALVRHAYLSALASTPIGSVLAIVYEGAPHIGTMRESGYEFFEPRASWDTEAVARTRPLLAVLPRSRFERALRVRSAALAGQFDGVQVEAAAIAQAFLARCNAA